MMVLAMILAVQGANPFGDLTPKEHLGPGPHTLIISDGSAITRVQYKTGAACQRARDDTRRQVAPRPDSPGIIHGPSRVKAFCVPR